MERYPSFNRLVSNENMRAAIQHAAARYLQERSKESNSWAASPGGVSWNAYLNRNNKGSIHRKMGLTASNGRLTNSNSAVTPLDMYLGLLYPSCPVGIEEKTRKKLRDFATRMTTGERIPKTQIERMDRLLKRLVAAGDKCGFAKKDPGKKYHLATTKEMTHMGYHAAGNSGKFFYKQPRKPDPVPNPRKGPKNPHRPPNAATSTVTTKKHSPSKRLKLKNIRTQGYAVNDHAPASTINTLYCYAFARQQVRRLVKLHFNFDPNLSAWSETNVAEFHRRAAIGDYSFVPLLQVQ